MTQPENTVPSVPQSVAEEDSVKAANDSIRETLLRRSGRDTGGSERQAAPRRSPRKTTDDE